MRRRNDICLQEDPAQPLQATPMLTEQGALLRRRDKTCVCLYTTGDMLGLGEWGRGLVEPCGAASRPQLGNQEEDSGTGSPELQACPWPRCRDRCSVKATGFTPSLGRAEPKMCRHSLHHVIRCGVQVIVHFETLTS